MTETTTPPAVLPPLNLTKKNLDRIGLVERIDLLRECLRGVIETSREWVDRACRAKGIPEGSPARAEEIAAGPVATARFLRLLIHSFTQIQQNGRTQPPGKARMNSQGRVEIPVVPEGRLFDGVVFANFRAWVVLEEGIGLQGLEERFAPQYDRNGARVPARIALVLGAGNVSSIPATDALSKIFLDQCAVLLKMNPVNDYLAPIFEKAFRPLIGEQILQIVSGGVEVGAAAVVLPEVETIHITGSVGAHDAIVWGTGDSGVERQRNGSPRLDKEVTSELGNVSPWIMVPGPYSERELNFQAENIAASIVNNGSFNCIATKVILTWKRWDQRENFLMRLNRILESVPRRKAYYPGACERFSRYTGSPAEADENGALPWTLLTGLSTEGPDHYFREESFACVTVEVPLDAETPGEFIERAVEFANDRLWGTLGVTLTVHPKFRKEPENEAAYQQALAELRYGTIAVNQWAGLAFALMSLPWGGRPGQPLEDVQSGRGWVHNSYMIEGIEKSILETPLTLFPKPIWFPTHRKPEPVAWRLLDLYGEPGVWNLLKLIKASLI